MNITIKGPVDPNLLGYSRSSGPPHGGSPGRGTGGPAPKRIVVGFGFWIFLVSDIIMFSAFFASYAVLHNATAGGPKSTDVLDLNTVALETGCLLASTFTCGLATIAIMLRRVPAFLLCMALTGAAGMAFLGLEISEFSELVARGDGPTRSAFLSAFFTLVGCHGVHVTLGILWLLTMMAQVTTKGFREDIRRRLLCFTLIWHVLDVIWVAIFTIVYLLGARA